MPVMVSSREYTQFCSICTRSIRPTTMVSMGMFLVSAVKRALDQAGIEIPFPYRTLTFGETVPVHMLETKE